MHDKFHCHWEENEALAGIQMFVTDMTRFFLNKSRKKSFGLNLPLNHTLYNSIVLENFIKSLKFDLKQLKYWFIKKCSIYKVSKL